MSGGPFALPAGLGRRVSLLVLALFFVTAGLNHFLNPEFYVRIMPPYLPAHEALVFWSGVFELLGGLAVLPRATRSAAGWGLVALLFAVFPANLHMALNPEPFVADGMPLAGLYARLPLQLVFALWAWWATRPDDA